MGLDGHIINKTIFQNKGDSGVYDEYFIVPGCILYVGHIKRQSEWRERIMIKPVLCITLTLVVAVTLSVYATENQTNYLESNGLEKVSSLQKKPAGWKSTEIPKTKEFVEFTWDDEHSYKADRSLKIKISEQHPDEESIAYNWYTDILNWQHGQKYEYSCWVKGQDLKEPVWVCVQCWNKGMTKMLKFVTTQHDYPLTGTFEWKKIGAVFMIPDNTDKVVLRAGIAAPGNNGGQMWFDEVHVREVGE